MDIETKYKIVEKIIQSNDDSLLSEVNLLLGLSEGDFWKEIPEEVKEAIHQAKAQLDQGEGIAHEQITAEVKKRFLNK
jgi:hypothetical protein